MSNDNQNGSRAGNGAGNDSSKNRGLLVFGRAFLKTPAMLGSIIPSSRFLVERTLRNVDWSRARVLVEYGPGVGTFTGKILKRMHPEAKLIVVETQSDFIQHLENHFQDPRLHVVHGSAEDVSRTLQELGAASADYVLSGIPFSLMSDEMRDSILRTTREVLEPEGAMLVYQFSPTIRKPLEEVFSRVDREFEPLNVPPATVYRCVP